MKWWIIICKRSIKLGSNSIIICCLIWSKGFILWILVAIAGHWICSDFKRCINSWGIVVSNACEWEISSPATRVSHYSIWAHLALRLYRCTRDYFIILSLPVWILKGLSSIVNFITLCALNNSHEFDTVAIALSKQSNLCDIYNRFIVDLSIICIIWGRTIILSVCSCSISAIISWIIGTWPIIYDCIIWVNCFIWVDCIIWVNCFICLSRSLILNDTY